MAPPDQMVVPPASVSEPPLRYWLVAAPVIDPPPLTMMELEPVKLPPDQVSAPVTVTVESPPRAPLLTVSAGIEYGPPRKLTVPLPPTLVATVYGTFTLVMPPV